MKKPKFNKVTNFTPPPSMGWLRRFRQGNQVRTRTGSVIYHVEYVVNGRYGQPYAILESEDSWYQYTVTEHNQHRYISI